MNNERGSDHKLLIMILGAVAAVFIAISSWAWVSLANRVDIIQATQAGRGERITKVETEVIAIRAQLASIEQKLDRVLERK